MKPTHKVTSEAGKEYIYDLHTTKIYGTDKESIKDLKQVLGFKSEYEVINMLIEFFKTEKQIDSDINALKKAKEVQKKATDKIRKEVLNKFPLIK